jgi:thiol-disulfide isomerase/thioredoxin
MPIINQASPLPESYKDLPVVAGKPLLVFFAASKDPRTGESWCPDVRAALPVLQATFSAEDQPHLTYIEVGQRTEYEKV